jgi:pimeloyl-ACP methyl ester carboxylesterase
LSTTADTTPPEYLTRADGLRIAFRMVKNKGAKGKAPTIVFLPGYMSDMQGGKARALEAWAVKQGRAMLRFDYSGCGESEGEFKDGTLSRWRDDVLLAIELLIRGPVVLVGSSMGGWLMLMVGEALGSDLAGMVGIAAAPDFTRWGFTDEQRATIARDGVLYQDNPYGPEPTPTWRGLYDDGVTHELLGREIAITCPVRLLHGQNDDDVPWKISLKLAEALASDDVQVTFIKDGDHRLSRDADVAVLLAAVAGVVGG